MVNLDSKSFSKVVKILKQHLIFVNFKVMNFNVQNDPKETLMFERYDLVDSMD